MRKTEFLFRFISCTIIILWSSQYYSWKLCWKEWVSRRLKIIALWKIAWLCAFFYMQPKHLVDVSFLISFLSCVWSPHIYDSLSVEEFDTHGKDQPKIGFEGISVYLSLTHRALHISGIEMIEVCFSPINPPPPPPPPPSPFSSTWPFLIILCLGG